MKSLVKTRTVNAGTSELIPKRNHLKFLTLDSPFLPFYQKNTHTEWSFWILSNDYSWWNNRLRFEMVHFSIKNAKCRVGESQVCNLRTTHSSVLNYITLVINSNTDTNEGSERYFPHSIGKKCLSIRMVIEVTHTLMYDE